MRVDDVGDVLHVYHYDAFGVEREQDDRNTNPFRFAGEYYDWETSTIYLRARVYNPRTGRFTQEDPHWNVGNMVFGDETVMRNDRMVPDRWSIMQAGNLYIYCLHNPVKFIDPSGYSIISLPEIATLADAMSTVGVAMKAAAAGAMAKLIPVAGWIAGAVIVAGALIYAGVQTARFVDDAQKAKAWALDQLNNPPRHLPGTYSVYLVRDSRAQPQNSVWYVGLTNDFVRRQGEHRRNYEKFGHLTADGAFAMTPIRTGLTRDQALVYEQGLMMAFGTLALANVINAIAPRRWGGERFATEIARMNSIFSTIP